MKEYPRFRLEDVYKKPEYKINKETIKTIVAEAQILSDALWEFRSPGTLPKISSDRFPDQELRRKERKARAQDEASLKKLFASPKNAPYNPSPLGYLKLHSAAYLNEELHRGVDETGHRKTEKEFRDEEKAISETYKEAKRLYEKYIVKSPEQTETFFSPPQKKIFTPPGASQEMLKVVHESLTIPESAIPEPVKAKPSVQRMKNPKTGRTVDGDKVEAFRSKIQKGLDIIEGAYKQRLEKISPGVTLPITALPRNSDEEEHKLKGLRELHKRVKSVHEEFEGSSAITDLEKKFDDTVTTWKKEHFEKTAGFTKNKFLANILNDFLKAAGWKLRLKTKTGAALEQADAAFDRPKLAAT